MEAKARDTQSTRERLRLLVDQLPDSELHAAQRFLEFVHEHGDPLLHMLMNAPEDDEPVTEEEEAAVREALEDVAGGRVVTMEELKRELGF